LLAVAGIALVTAIGLGGGIYYGARSKTPPVSPVKSENVVPPPPVASTDVVTAFLRIDPGEADVRIDGVATDVIDGGVRIERKPGETVRVTVRVGDAGVEQRVVVTSEGSTLPPEVKVQLPESPEPSVHANRPVGRPPPSKGPAPTATEKPAPPAASATGQKGPKFNTEW
jgi:hypothetical protein